MSDQGVEYSTFIRTELGHEYDRRDAVNSRGTALITSATALITITLTVFAVLKGQDFRLHGLALAMIFIALFAFLSSAVLSILAGINWKYDVTSISTLRDMYDTHWTDSDVSARNVTAYCNVNTINSLRAGTNIKFRFLLWAAASQAFAVLALSVSAVAVIA